jgi:hypothetical protein
MISGEGGGGFDGEKDFSSMDGGRRDKEDRRQ